jgi:ATP/maltotriose-dependent transcriptional regulator MalT
MHAIRLEPAPTSHPDEAPARSGGAETILVNSSVPDVLDGLEPALCQFLLETSILDELCSGLCDAVTGRDGSKAMLDRIVGIESLNVRADNAAGWHRHHDRFRELLRAELGRAHPELVPELHHRAGEWLHDHGDPVRAVEHALAADRPELASDWLVAGSETLFRSGRSATILTLGNAIASATGGASMPLTGTMAMAAIVTGTHAADVERLLAQFEERHVVIDGRAALGTILDDAAARTGGLFTDGDVRSGDIAGGCAPVRVDLRDPAALRRKPVAFVEPLTFRELEVLRLLPSHRSYREIGAELYVSVNTVKYHVKAIYRKLGAEGRADAVQIAQESGLVAASA